MNGLHSSIKGKLLNRYDTLRKTMAEQMLTILFLLLFLNAAFVVTERSCTNRLTNNCSIPAFAKPQISSEEETKSEASDSNNNGLYCNSSNSSQSGQSEGKAECNSPWSYCDDGLCKCGTIPNAILQCDTKKNVSILSCYCATFNEMEGVTEVGKCLYRCVTVHKGKNAIQYHAVTNKRELNEFMCGIPTNRTGTLCGECKDGFYPLAYSFDMTCTECNFNWWRYILAAFLPLTIFSFIIILFKINATSSHLHGFVYYSQVMSMPVLARMLFQITRTQPKVQAFIRSLLLLYGVWNFDFFRSMNLGICIGTDTLQTLALDFAVCIYPLLLALLTYLLITLYDLNFRPLVIIWKPFRTFLLVCH